MSKRSPIGHYTALLWLLSGPFVGVILICLPWLMPPIVGYVIFALFIPLETAHSFSPIALAWSHRGFRQDVLYQHPWWFIGLPLLVLVICMTVGYSTFSFKFKFLSDNSPEPVIVWVYSAFNLWHFGMQNFGVLRLSGGGKVVPRWVQITACLGLTVLVMTVLTRVLPSQWLMPYTFLMYGMVSINHWVVDLGLSMRVIKRPWVFLCSLMILGLIGFIWMRPTPAGVLITVIPTIICARLGLGFVHFLYSRWVWKLSDPRVRATIGKDLYTGLQQA